MPMRDSHHPLFGVTRQDIERIVEQILEEITPDQPRAEQWSLWRQALEERLETFEEMVKRGEPLPETAPDLDELRRYVAALREEEIISQFFEDQIRFVLIKAMVLGRRNEREEDGNDE
ncbi:MAG: hypothetical protein NZ959_12055 [Armatimonadetes bacterium]|nr:hypothetical protein [Armatimonadota bacterium]MDW8121248.1 hypothetical protein [Armatimonadota bacterium]